MIDRDVVTVRAADGAVARLHPHGAHVLSWIPAGGSERLFLSPKTGVGDGLSIRGGIPVIFPQFASEGPLPKHGFVRNRRWELDEIGEDVDGSAGASFVLADDSDTRALWPHRFVATLSVRVAASTLSVTLAIDSHDRQPLTFTAALHTYLAVDDIADASLEGLKGVRYRDAVSDNRRDVETAERLRFDGEFDRVYEAAPPQVRLLTPSRRIVIVSTHLPDTVVWNPGAARCAALADMPADGYRRMLCVESAVIATPVLLPGGATWRGSQTLIDRGAAGRL
jgi:glucose-6-phosphate 1-epimerase